MSDETSIEKIYKLRRILSTRESGTVFLASGKADHRPAVVKVFVAPTGPDAEATSDHFLRATERLAAVEHPGLPRTTGFGVLADGSLYLAAEPVEGKPLSSLAGAPAFTVIAATSLVLEALEALRAAGLFHGHLDAENVLWDGARVRLLGLGGGFLRPTPPPPDDPDDIRAVGRLLELLLGPANAGEAPPLPALRILAADLAAAEHAPPSYSPLVMSLARVLLSGALLETPTGGESAAVVPELPPPPPPASAEPVAAQQPAPPAGAPLAATPPDPPPAALSEPVAPPPAESPDLAGRTMPIGAEELAAARALALSALGGVVEKPATRDTATAPATAPTSGPLPIVTVDSSKVTATLRIDRAVLEAARRKLDVAPAPAAGEEPAESVARTMRIGREALEEARALAAGLRGGPTSVGDTIERTAPIDPAEMAKVRQSPPPPPASSVRDDVGATARIDPAELARARETALRGGAPPERPAEVTERVDPVELARARQEALAASIPAPEETTRPIEPAVLAKFRAGEPPTVVTPVPKMPPIPMPPPMARPTPPEELDLPLDRADEPEPPVAPTSPRRPSRRPLQVAGLAAVGLLLGGIVWMSQRAGRVDTTTAPPTPAPSAAPAPAPVAEPPVPEPVVSVPAGDTAALAEIHSLMEEGKLGAAATRLAAIPPDAVAGWDDATRREHEALGARLRQEENLLVSTLKPVLSTGDLEVLATVPLEGWGDGAALAPEAKKLLSRALALRRTGEALRAAAKGRDPLKTLDAAVAMLRVAPASREAAAAREGAAQQVAAEAETLERGRDHAAALAKLAPIRSRWPDRPGLAATVTRLEALVDNDTKAEAALRTAEQAAGERKPDKGLAALKSVRAGSRHEARVTELRGRLEAQLQQLDGKPPRLRFPDGKPPRFGKGEKVRIALVVEDDYEVRDVKLFVKFAGESIFKSMPLERDAAGWTLSLDPWIHKDQDFRIYAVATDPSGHEGRLGTEKEPMVCSRKVLGIF